MGGFGKTGKLELVNGQMFDWICICLLFPVGEHCCERGSAGEKVERAAAFHMLICFHMKTSVFIIGYSLFSHLINLLPGRQRAGAAACCLVQPVTHPEYQIMNGQIRRVSQKPRLKIIQPGKRSRIANVSAEIRLGHSGLTNRRPEFAVSG